MAGNTFTIYRGDSQDYTMHFTTNGSDMNITGFSVWFTVKNDLADVDGSAVIQKTIISHGSPTTGWTSFNLSNALTSGLSEKTYFYDIQMKSGTQVITATRGNFVVTKDVTITI